MHGVPCSCHFETLKHTMKVYHKDVTCFREDKVCCLCMWFWVECHCSPSIEQRRYEVLCLLWLHLHQECGVHNSACRDKIQLHMAAAPQLLQYSSAHHLLGSSHVEGCEARHKQAALPKDILRAYSKAVPMFSCTVRQKAAKLAMRICLTLT